MFIARYFNLFGKITVAILLHFCCILVAVFVTVLHNVHPCNITFTHVYICFVWNYTFVDENRDSVAVAVSLHSCCIFVAVSLHFGETGVAFLLPFCCNLQRNCNTRVCWSCDLNIELLKVLHNSNAFAPLFHNCVPTTSYKSVGGSIIQSHCFSHTAHPCHTITSHDNHSYLA